MSELKSVGQICVKTNYGFAVRADKNVKQQNFLFVQTAVGTENSWRLMKRSSASFKKIRRYKRK